MAIQLANVFQAREAWKKLVQCQLKPATAYKLAKYARQVSEEDVVIEGRRTEMIQRLGVATGNGFSVEQGSEGHVKFLQEFSELLAQDTKLDPCDMRFDELVDEISKFDKNELTVADCGALAAFFKEG